MNNELTGEIILSRNDFDGNIPDSIINLGNLQVLDLSRNSLRGGLPEGFTGLENLQILDLSLNFLGGQLPENFGDLASLIEVRLNTNAVSNGPFFGFTGQIPASVGFLDNLVRFDIYENLLNGTLPSEFGFLDNLAILDVALNPDLGGSVPTEFENLNSLRELYIFGTNIEGEVPQGLCEKDLYIETGCGEDAPEISCDCCTCSQL